MNYKKKKCAWVDGALYNLENWISVGVKKESIRRDEKGNKIIENLLYIELPDTNRKTNILYYTYESAKKYCINVHLGIPASAIDEMFLKAEVEDD